MRPYSTKKNSYTLIGHQKLSEDVKDLHSWIQFNDVTGKLEVNVPMLKHNASISFKVQITVDGMKTKEYTEVTLKIIGHKHGSVTMSSSMSRKRPSTLFMLLFASGVLQNCNATCPTADCEYWPEDNGTLNQWLRCQAIGTELTHCYYRDNAFNAVNGWYTLSAGVWRAYPNWESIYYNDSNEEKYWFKWIDGYVVAADGYTCVNWEVDGWKTWVPGTIDKWQDCTNPAYHVEDYKCYKDCIVDNCYSWFNNDDATCKTWDPDYYVDGTGCKLDCDVEYCDDCTTPGSPNVCTDCQDDYKSDGMGGCIEECIPTDCDECKSDDNQYCIDCKQEGYVPDDNGVWELGCNVEGCGSCEVGDLNSWE